MSDNCRGRIFRLLYPVFFKCKLKKNKLKRLFLNIVLYVLCKHGPFCFYPKSSTDHKRGNPLKVGNNLWKEVQPGKPSFSVFLRNELNSSLALRHSSNCTAPENDPETSALTTIRLPCLHTNVGCDDITRACAQNETFGFNNKFDAQGSVFT